MKNENQPLSINPTPKAQFQQSTDNISKHKRLLESAEFERGIQFSLLQMQAEIVDQKMDGNSAAAATFRLMGAHDFIKIFRTLAESPVVIQTKRDNGQLIQV